MKRFFAPNLTTAGRVVRAVFGLALIAIGLLISAPGRWVCVVLVISGGFAIFEAVRGWCIMRACGVKTLL